MEKLRVNSWPSQPKWLHASLALGARGLTTGAVPCDRRSIEVATPLSQDHRARSDDRASVTWYSAMMAIRNVLDGWRSPFFGWTGVQFRWARST
jgi:hypothetical protein